MTQQEHVQAEFPSNKTDLTSPASLSEIASILQLFRTECKSKGWQTKSDEDWVKTSDGYHNFIYGRPPINVFSFKKVAEKGKCVVIDGGAYRIVSAAYTAWFLSEPPALALKELERATTENPVLAEKTALYCLSQTATGHFMCSVINKTKSRVFKEFELFLNKKLGVELKQLTACKKNEQI